MNPTPVLDVDLVRKNFAAVGDAPPKQALARLAFRVGGHEMVAVIGPSGCGKTTLLNLVADLEGGAVGRIQRFERSRLAYVFQEPRLLPWLTVAGNLRLVLAGAEYAEERIDEVLREVGLAEARDVYASRLSLGMARRVALARAFVIRPALLLLDEPFVSLDHATARHLRLLLLTLLRRHQSSALFVTHNLKEAVQLADRLLFLSASPGRLLLDLPIDLTDDQRTDESAVDACQRRLIADHKLDPLTLAPTE
ncbi:MAG: ABC transporter ATP-binding protein [Geminicoccaceae bacterium]